MLESALKVPVPTRYKLKSPPFVKLILFKVKLLLLNSRYERLEPVELALSILILLPGNARKELPELPKVKLRISAVKLPV